MRVFFRVLRGSEEELGLEALGRRSWEGGRLVVLAGVVR